MLYTFIISKFIYLFKILHNIISRFFLFLYLFVTNPLMFINKILIIKNLLNLPFINLFKFIIKILTYLNAFFGISVIVYFDTNLLFNIFDYLINWFKDYKDNFNQYLFSYYQSFLKYVKDFIKKLIDKDKKVVTDMEISQNKSEIYKKMKDNEYVDIGNYKLNRKDYDEKGNLQKFLEDKNSNSTNSNKWTFIYSPYFYIPCLIAIIVSGGFVVYYFDIDYLTYIPWLGSIYKIFNNKDNNNNDSPTMGENKIITTDKDNNKRLKHFIDNIDYNTHYF